MQVNIFNNAPNCPINFYNYPAPDAAPISLQPPAISSAAAPSPQIEPEVVEQAIRRSRKHKRRVADEQASDSTARPVETADTRQPQPRRREAYTIGSSSSSPTRAIGTAAATSSTDQDIRPSKASVTISSKSSRSKSSKHTTETQQQNHQYSSVSAPTSPPPLKSVSVHKRPEPKKVNIPAAPVVLDQIPSRSTDNDRWTYCPQPPKPERKFGFTHVHKVIKENGHLKNAVQYLHENKQFLEKSMGDTFEEINRRQQCPECGFDHGKYLDDGDVSPRPSSSGSSYHTAPETHHVKLRNAPHRIGKDETIEEEEEEEDSGTLFLNLARQY